MDEYLKELLNLDTPIPLVYRNVHNSTKIENTFRSDNSKFDFKEFYSVSPSKIVRYCKNLKADTRDYTQDWLNRGAKLLPDGTLDKTGVNTKLTSTQNHHGLINRKGHSKINKAIDWLIHLAPVKKSWNPETKSWYYWKANMVTLTLPSKQMHTDKFIKSKLVNKFMVYGSRDWAINNYLIRSEAQANGNIHFHIVTDVFIPWQEIQTTWNNILNDFGYIDAFEKKHGHRNPNSTDVHSLKNIKNIGAYLSKYCSKNSKGVTVLQTQFSFNTVPKRLINYHWNFPPKKCKFYRQIHGRLWSCSQELSKLQNCRFMASDDMQIELATSHKKIANKRIDFDYVTVFKVGINELQENDLISLSKKVTTFVNAIVSERPPPQEFIPPKKHKHFKKAK